eukprot:gnl/TRDRNA2_/TRDRNA2_184987_c0_seq1.p2 gnl/TRDRNA2_/TRDRNA2_184987_c0~~gnl/TRDRNA2_/TRDRNA2_184987_c0_seq1.p2  ORF type:complete len:130 (-),score=27.26 gnl/TRDRNA2_/TRDRNA2_184987_c0_seq1:113-502(-)
MAQLRVAVALSLLVACSTARVAQKSQFRLHQHRNASAVVLSHDISELAADCKCMYKGDCNCRAAVWFMECMHDACSGGACPCPENHFEQTCQDWHFACDGEEGMEITCTKKGMTCSQGKDRLSYVIKEK